MDVQLIGKQDPYCEARLGLVGGKSPVHNDGGTHPTWNYTHDFPVSMGKLLSEQYLDVRVRDKETLLDRDIATACISLR